MGVLGYLTGVLGYLMVALGYLMGVPKKYPRTPEAGGRPIGGVGGRQPHHLKLGGSGGAGRPPQLRLFVLQHQYTHDGS